MEDSSLFRCDSVSFGRLNGSQWLDSGRQSLLAEWHHHIPAAVHLTYRTYVCLVARLTFAITFVIVVSHCSWCLKLKVVMKLYLICEQEQLRQFTHQTKKACCSIFSSHCTRLWILNEDTQISHCCNKCHCPTTADPTSTEMLQPSLVACCLFLVES